MTPNEKPSDDGQPRPVPRKQAESPQAFYERVTKRADVRRLLRKLATLTRSQPPEWP